MKIGDGSIYIPMDLMEQILRIPITNEGKEDEYWEGQILMNYAMLLQTGKSTDPQEISNLQKIPVETIVEVLEKYKDKGWLEQLNVKDEALEAAQNNPSTCPACKGTGERKKSRGSVVECETCGGSKNVYQNSDGKLTKISQNPQNDRI